MIDRAPVGVGPRAAAFLIDWVLFAFMIAVVWIVSGGVNSSAEERHPEEPEHRPQPGDHRRGARLLRRPRERLGIDRRQARRRPAGRHGERRPGHRARGHPAHARARRSTAFSSRPSSPRSSCGPRPATSVSATGGAARSSCAAAAATAEHTARRRQCGRDAIDPSGGASGYDLGIRWKGGDRDGKDPHQAHRADGARERRAASGDVGRGPRPGRRRHQRGRRRPSGPNALGIFSCSKATNEVNFVAQKFARVAVGTNNIDSCNRT